MGCLGGRKCQQTLQPGVQPAWPLCPTSLTRRAPDQSWALGSTCLAQEAKGRAETA